MIIIMIIIKPTTWTDGLMDAQHAMTRTRDGRGGPGLDPPSWRARDCHCALVAACLQRDRYTEHTSERAFVLPVESARSLTRFRVKVESGSWTSDGAHCARPTWGLIALVRVGRTSIIARYAAIANLCHQHTCTATAVQLKLSLLQSPPSARAPSSAQACSPSVPPVQDSHPPAYMPVATSPSDPDLASDPGRATALPRLIAASTPRSEAVLVVELRANRPRISSTRNFLSASLKQRCRYRPISAVRGWGTC